MCLEISAYSIFLRCKSSAHIFSRSLSLFFCSSVNNQFDNKNFNIRHMSTKHFFQCWWNIPADTSIYIFSNKKRQCGSNVLIYHHTQKRNSWKSHSVGRMKCWRNFNECFRCQIKYKHEFHFIIFISRCGLDYSLILLI